MSQAAHLVSESSPPEQGQLVRVRNRLFLTSDVIPAEDERGNRVHRVDLECLDDDRMGDLLTVIWEREVNTEIVLANALPIPEGRWDSPAVFDAFLTAIRWSSSSVLREHGLLAPFHGAIEIEPYQLEPVARAVRAPRVNLLIADDVGLGKTIEAGLVLQELLARARIRNCLILCPASLQRQWQEEMREKFNLRFDIIDRDRILELRREYGTHVNPWRSFPRLITSMDFLKAQRHLSNFLARDEHGNPPRWDLLIVDEAHNFAPAGRTRYIRDSQRTQMLRQIAPVFEHRLFLSATPHNGFTESFTALLEMLDPLRFHSDNTVDPDAVRTVMIRRLKEELRGTDATLRVFPQRDICALRVPDEPDERRAAELLDLYIESRVGRARDREELYPVRFALNVLKKRFLSSPLAFCNSLETHLENVTHSGGRPVEPADPSYANRLMQRAREDAASDEERDRTEREAVAETSKFFGELTAEEDAWLGELWAWADARRTEPDAKLRVLQSWLDEHLRTAGRFNDERLILFTEYRDTHDYLHQHLTDWLGEERVLSITGDTPLREREEVKAAFQAPPAEHPVRVLVATDAAAEGLNFQNHCRYLIHWEIPWNPNRMEQRNGRIDRHGQERHVFIYHFLYDNRRDTPFLETLVRKVQQMRHDLGGVASVIESSVERYMSGDRGVDLDTVAPRKTLEDDIRRERLDLARIRKLRDELERTRYELDLRPETLRKVLDAALRLETGTGLEPASGDLAPHGAILRQSPRSWGDACARSLRDAQGRLLTLVFDPEVARGRRDATLVHLHHPLMQRALAVFRRNMFALGVHTAQRLHRANYLVVPDVDLPAPLLVVPARLLASGPSGRKLHEAVELLAWEVSSEGIVPLDRFDPSWPPEAERYPPIPTALAERLRLILSRHEQAVNHRLEAFAQARRGEIERRLEERTAREQSEVRQLADQRRKEIQTRLKRLRDLGLDQPLLPFDQYEREQIRDDIRRLERRLDDLERERREAPARIAERYRLRHLRAFPLGVRFLLPESVVREGRLP